jgi:hypothetical protein
MKIRNINLKTGDVLCIKIDGSPETEITVGNDGFIYFSNCTGRKYGIDFSNRAAKEVCAAKARIMEREGDIK